MADQVKTKMWVKITMVVVVVIICILIIFWLTYGKFLHGYSLAEDQLKEGDFYKAFIEFRTLNGFKDSSSREMESFQLYLESAVDQYNNDSYQSLADGYDWLYRNGVTKEDIISSIYNIADKISSEEQKNLVIWMDETEFSKFLPTITVIEEIDGVENILAEVNQISFSEEISLAKYALLATFREDYIPTRWSFILAPKESSPTLTTSEQKTSRSANSRQHSISLDAEINFITDARIFVEWGPRIIGGKNQIGSTLIYDKKVVTDGWRYIEVAPVETIWNDIPWVNLTTRYLNLSTTIGSGKENTDKIVRETSPIDQLLKIPNAANLCGDFEYMGHSDWALPSKDELDLIFQLYEAGEFKGMQPTTYWSSTDKDWFNAWSQNFFNGLQSELNKNEKASVIALRYF